jgi:hypothetical protein
MSNSRVAVLVAMALVIAAAVWFKIPIGTSTAPTQAPPPGPAAVAPPAEAPAPVAPASPASSPPAAAPAAPETPPPPAAQAPATPPTPAAEAPAAHGPAAPKVQTADPFGEEQTLTAKKVIILKGSATWDNAFETLVGSLKTLSGFLEKQDIKPAGSSP